VFVEGKGDRKEYDCKVRLDNDEQRREIVRACCEQETDGGRLGQNDNIVSAIVSLFSCARLSRGFPLAALRLQARETSDVFAELTEMEL
jgi:hypothetical protein